MTVWLLPGLSPVFYRVAVSNSWVVASNSTGAVLLVCRHNDRKHCLMNILLACHLVGEIKSYLLAPKQIMYNTIEMKINGITGEGNPPKAHYPRPQTLL